MAVNNLLLRQKYHQYKSFSPTGAYLGLIQNVKETFNYNQLIASAFTQIQFTVEQSADVASQAVTPLQDEQGNTITDESGNPLLIERQPDVVGGNNSNALIANNNLLQVWEYSNYYPNGILKFSGYISKWKTTFGGSDDILVTAISNGQDLSQYIVQSGDTSYISQATDTGNNFGSGLIDLNKGGDYEWVDQTFTVPDATVLIGGISVELTPPEAGILTILLYQMNGLTPNRNADTLLTYGSAATTFTTKTVQKVSFNPIPTLNSGITYYFMVQWSANTQDIVQASIFASNSDPYTGGLVYTNQTNNGTDGVPALQGGYSLYFVIYKHGGSITGAYTNDDPSFIIGDIMTNYIAQGGLITKPVTGYTNTNTITSYTFKMQTILQAIQAVVALAPATWYWYVDPASGILQFAKADTTADITIIKGRHIDEIDIEATRENIVNSAYFTGGDDGTGTSTNILVQVNGTKGTNRTGLALLSDNRVNSTSGGVTTARLIANNYINSNSAETYITNVTVQDQAMDINLIKLGQTVGFSGFGNFVDNLLLQVVGLNYQSDQVILQLGTLPKRTSKAFADAEAALAYLQTVANPTTPS